jgi:hypothetical protein
MGGGSDLEAMEDLHLELEVPPDADLSAWQMKLHAGKSPSRRVLTFFDGATRSQETSQ